MAVILPASLLVGWRAARGGTHLDWADKFTSAFVAVQLIQSTGGMSVSHFWDADGDPAGDSNEWTPVGMQGIAGRANAVERVQLNYFDVSGTACVNVTVSITRTRVFPAPSWFASCAQSGTNVGSVSFSRNGCSFPNADTYWSNRNLPEMDFSAESGVTANDYTGYRSHVAAVRGDGATESEDGCFSIYWTSP
jgi:hypothetical protein